MKLVPLKQWIDDTFEDPKPAPQTIREQIRIGEWPAHAAQRVGRRYFIDVDRIGANDGNWLLDATA